MTISQLQEKLFLLAQTHGDMQIFISTDWEDGLYEPKHFEEITLRESDADLECYPHLQFQVPQS
jgi:hypothetical protein